MNSCSYDYDSIGENNESRFDCDLPNHPMPVVGKTVACCIYAFIFCVGVIGNALVIYVVLRFTKTLSVTDQYICNLAVSDILSLIGLSLELVTVIHETWIFGVVMCKIFYILISSNSFAGLFTLTVMSADRYLAVCHPISSMGYRTPVVSRWICLGVWLASMVLMTPIFLYANTQSYGDQESCVINWPIDDPSLAAKAFIWYAFVLGFAIPVTLISIFYTLVVVRLKTSGPGKKSDVKKKTHRKVTKMVLTVIAAYVICWLPYWVFQVTNMFTEGSGWVRVVVHVATILRYTNSMLNPLLYAFLAETFRKSFIKALCCASFSETSRAHQGEHNASTGRAGHNQPRDPGLNLELAGEKSVEAPAEQFEKDDITVEDCQAL